MKINDDCLLNHLLLVAFLFFSCFEGYGQDRTQVKSQTVKGVEVETGYFYNGQPYAKMGEGDKILFNVEALSFEHKPPEGFLLKQFIKQGKPFLDNYTIYLIGRKPDLPDNYLYEEMSEDYAQLLKYEFKSPVDIMGVSTGGSIIMYLAANHPQYINKAVIISSAYKISDAAEIVEDRAAQYFKEEKYGKTLAAMADIMYKKGPKRILNKMLMYSIGSAMLKDVQYPDDFQVEIMADKALNFKSRLHEIEVATLIVSGKEDIAYSLEDVKLTAAKIPNSELLLFEDYGHDLIFANHKKVTQKISEFLAK